MNNIARRVLSRYIARRLHAFTVLSINQLPQSPALASIVERSMRLMSQDLRRIIIIIMNVCHLPTIIMCSVIAETYGLLLTVDV